MKKTLYTLFAALAVFAVSCQPNTPDNPGDPDNPADNPGGNEEPEYVAPVTIDGNFDDWAKIDASKLFVADCAAESKTKALKTLKVYMDELFVFFYFEYDDALLPDKSDVQCHFYFNADNDETTGGYANQFSTGCFEYMCEGHIFRNDAICSFDPSVNAWIGETGAAGWDWEDVYPSGSGMFEGNGKDGTGGYSGGYALETLAAKLIGSEQRHGAHLGHDGVGDLIQRGFLRIKDKRVEQIIKRDERSAYEEPFFPQMERPQEIHAAQIAQKKGGVADGQQTSSDVANAEDKEDDCVDFVFAKFVCFK